MNTLFTKVLALSLVVLIGLFVLMAVNAMANSNLPIGGLL